MKANELRIGNYLRGNPLSIPRRNIHSDGIFSITALAIHYWEEELFYLDWKPIPLTEEWLLKLGFKYQDRDVSHGNDKIERFFIKKWYAGGDDYWLEINLNPITKDTNGFFWLNWNIGGGRDFVHLPRSCKLEYIHQLQNLYFALTGEELTITDPVNN